MTDDELSEMIEMADKIGDRIAKGETEGNIQCVCGGNIKWISSGPRSMRAACDRCTFSVVS